MHRLVLLAAVLSLTSGHVAADIIIVPLHYPTIQQAINAASDGDEILVQPGTYPEPLVIDGLEITITSFGGSSATVIDVSAFPGTYSARFLNGADVLVSLDGFTLQGSIGGVLASNSTPIIRNCVIRDVSDYGIHTGGAGADSIKVIDCELIGTGAGTGIRVGSSAGVSVAGVTISNYSVGIRHVNSNAALSVTDSVITANGRGLLVDSGTSVVLERTEFSSHSIDDGGAIHIASEVHVTATDCTFNENSSIDKGGAIYVNGNNCDLVMTDCTFRENSASDDGGVIYVAGLSCDLELTGCTFRGNVASNDGGAIYVWGGGLDLQIQSCVFDDNRGDVGGAVLIFSSGSVIVAASEFRFNTALVDGGAIRNHTAFPADMSLENTSFCANSEPQVSGPWTNLGGNEFAETCQPLGACCFGGECHLLSAAACATAGGFYYEDDTTCEGIECEGCQSDVTGDGAVGFDDLLRILSDWGPCP